MEAQNPEPGVYLLFKRKRLVYIGRSKDPVKRVKAHKMNGRAFDYCITFPCPPDDVNWIEVALIEAMNPPQNRLGVTAPRDPEDDADLVQIIKHVHMPIPPPSEDPDTALPMHKARWRVEKYGLTKEFDAAVKSGELPSVPKNPAIDRPGARRLITVGDVDEWRRRAQEARRPHGWRAETV